MKCRQCGKQLPMFTYADENDMDYTVTYCTSCDLRWDSRIDEDINDSD